MLDKTAPGVDLDIDINERPLAEQDPLPGEDITGLLRAWSAGDAAAQEKLFELVYPELRRLARRHLARQGSGISVQATDLAHEAYLRLVDQRQGAWQCRAQFFALAATFIRRALIDLVKHRRRHKRGGDAVHVALDEVLIAGPELDLDVLALDRALSELAEVHVTTARIVELRYFAGMSLDETAEVMGLGRSTVQRKWLFAKAWLARKLQGNP